MVCRCFIVHDICKWDAPRRSNNDDSKEICNNDFVERGTRGRNRVGKFYTIMKLVFSLPVAFVYIVGFNPMGFLRKKQERLFLFLPIIQWKPLGVYLL